MKIAFSGCRDRELSPHMIMGYVGEGVVVLVGDCPTGVDRSVRDWCARAGVTAIVYHKRDDVPWPGKGPERNRRLVGDADHLVAFWDGESPGTKDAILQAVKKGIGVSIQPLGAEAAR